MSALRGSPLERKDKSHMGNEVLTVKAIQFRNIDEAKQVFRQVMSSTKIEMVFDDGEDEPQGLLSIIPEDRVTEEEFYALFDQNKGVLIEVEKIVYSGFGPPADPQDYMGFAREHCAYVVKGQRYPVEIYNCPQNAMDIHHLEALILDQQHPLNREHLREKLDLEDEWTFDDLFELIASGLITGEEIDRLIHQGIQ